MSPQTIRQKLRSWLQITHQFSSGDVFIDELCIVGKKNRADLVHANGRLCGFEVKSEFDTLKRWQDQRNAYFEVFDEVWLCCHRKHATRALADSDTKYGILIIDDFGCIAVLRPAKKNEKVSPFFLAELLWRENLDSICKKYDLPVNRRDKIVEARKKLVSGLPLDIIQKEVLNVLKKRYAILL